MTRRSNPSCAPREIQRKRREKIMESIERGMTYISKILEDSLFQMRNDDIEPKRNVEKKDSHEEECEMEREKTKESDKKEVEKNEEKKESENEKQEKNSLKFWPTITLVPSSKLVCVVKCWDSSNFFQSPNISSLCHERNKFNEEIFSPQVEGKYEIWNGTMIMFMNQNGMKSKQLVPIKV